MSSITSLLIRWSPLFLVICFGANGTELKGCVHSALMDCSRRKCIHTETEINPRHRTSWNNAASASTSPKVDSKYWIHIKHDYNNVSLHHKGWMPLFVHTQRSPGGAGSEPDE
jgi:hypothetical protein